MESSVVTRRDALRLELGYWSDIMGPTTDSNTFDRPLFVVQDPPCHIASWAESDIDVAIAGATEVDELDAPSHALSPRLESDETHRYTQEFEGAPFACGEPLDEGHPASDNRMHCDFGALDWFSQLVNDTPRECGLSEQRHRQLMLCFRGSRCL